MRAADSGQTRAMPCPRKSWNTHRGGVCIGTPRRSGLRGGAHVWYSSFRLPLTQVRTRLLATDSYKLGVTGTMRSIVVAEGVGGLYRGILPALLSMAPNGAVFYGVYDCLKVRPREIGPGASQREVFCLMRIGDRDSSGRLAHAAVSRRPPNPANTMVPYQELHIRCKGEGVVPRPRATFRRPLLARFAPNSSLCTPSLARSV